MNEFKFNGLNKIWSNRFLVLFIFCLLYTSDAADDIRRVDLGGRRISKNTFEDNGDKIETKSKNLSKLEAA